MTNKITSPLRYPGSKERAKDKILSFVPLDIKKVISPFFGGGAIEIELAKKGVRVLGFDNFPPLVCFWQCCLNEPELVARLAKPYLNMTNDTFHRLIAELTATDFEHAHNFHSKLNMGWTHAAKFFAVNRRSFNGLTLQHRGKIAEDKENDRFGESAIRKLAKFPTLPISVKLADYSEIITHASPDSFLYLDPPYHTKATLYGYRGDKTSNFPHEMLAAMLKTRENWLLSYNDCEAVRSLYSGCYIEELEWNYSAWGDTKGRGSEPRKEVIIMPRQVQKSDKLF